MSRFLDKCRGVLRAAPIALIPCRRHDVGDAMPVSPASPAGDMREAATQWLNYWRSLGHNIVNEGHDRQGVARGFRVSEEDGLPQDFLPPHLAVHDRGQRDGATRAAEVLMRSIPGLMDAVFDLVAQERAARAPSTWAEAYGRYLRLRAMSEATPSDDEQADARVEAYAVAMDHLIEDVPAPSAAEVLIKLNLALERSDAFEEMFPDHLRGIKADLTRLAADAEPPAAEFDDFFARDMKVPGYVVADVRTKAAATVLNGTPAIRIEALLIEDDSANPDAPSPDLVAAWEGYRAEVIFNNAQTEDDAGRHDAYYAMNAQGAPANLADAVIKLRFHLAMALGDRDFQEAILDGTAEDRAALFRASGNRLRAAEQAHAADVLLFLEGEA